MTHCSEPSCHDVTPNPGLYRWKKDEHGQYFCRHHSAHIPSPAPSPDRMRKGGKVGNMWRRRKNATN